MKSATADVKNMREAPADFFFFFKAHFHLCPEESAFQQSEERCQCNQRL